MKLYLFGIGGSGARVVKSFIHLLSSGVNIGDCTEIVPFIIDTDLKNGDSNHIVDLVLAYNQIQRSLYNEDQNLQKDAQFFKYKIQVPPKLQEFKNIAREGVTFKQFLNLQDEIQNKLIESLYDNSNTESSETELNLDLAVGFKGNPNIGSVVFNLLNKNPVFADFKSRCTAKDRIFIISSIFGGNGASGFPAIIKMCKGTGNLELDKAKKGALSLFPYYDVVGSDSKPINSKLFLSKAKSALSFYNEDMDILNLDAHYFIGDKDVKAKYKYSEGGSYKENGSIIDQMNPANIIELIGATAIVDFLNKDDANFKNNKLAFGMDMNESRNTDKAINLDYFEKFIEDDGNNLFKERVLSHFIKFNFLYKKILEIEYDRHFMNLKHVSNASKVIIDLLRDYYKYNYSIWLDEIRKDEVLVENSTEKRVENKRYLDVFDFNLITNNFNGFVKNKSSDYNLEAQYKTLTDNWEFYKNDNVNYTFIKVMEQIADDYYKSLNKN
ncbi:MAG: hypothetical protein U0T69_10845 [Chitinophagales bacterium]